MICIPLIGVFVPTLPLFAGAKFILSQFIWGVVVTTINTLLIWEGNRKIIMLLREKYSWETHDMKRLYIEAPAIFLYSFIVNVSVLYIAGIRKLNDPVMVFGVYNGLILTFLIFSIYEGSYFFSKWKQSFIQAELYKKEHLQAQYEALKNQVNPHFLFNSLSVLSTLVNKDPELATRFISQLARVYRYVLDSKNKELVELETEVAFIRSYIFLMQIRFGKNFQTHISIPENVLVNKYIPPLTLQMLVENALKHNEASEKNPLRVEIYSVGDELLVIANNRKPKREVSVSTGTGLENINKQYTHISNKTINVAETENDFKVEIPLLRVQPA